MVKNITCIILTKNSTENIANLKYIYSVFEKIVVVDDFSEDDTIEKIKQIDKENRIRIYTRKLDDFSSQRNFASNLSTTDWVFHLDSDEMPDKELVKELIQLDTKICNTSMVAFKVERRNFFVDMNIGSELKIRLFNKNVLSFVGEVHEDLAISEKVKIGFIKGAIIHKSYNKIEDYFRKLDVYLKLEKEKLQQHDKSLIYILAKVTKRFFTHILVLFKNIIVNRNLLKPLLWFCLCWAYDLIYFSIYLYLRYFKSKNNGN